MLHIDDRYIIEFLASFRNDEHYYFLSKVNLKSKKLLMFELMNELGYSKLIPQTLQDELKIENFKL